MRKVVWLWEYFTTVKKDKVIARLNSLAVKQRQSPKFKSLEYFLDFVNQDLVVGVFQDIDINDLICVFE